MKNIVTRVVTVKINVCEKCEFSSQEKVYTGDSFDDMHDLKCEKMKGKLITCKDWYDEDTKIPKWCPLLKRKKKKKK